MAASFNKVLLMGNLTRDPELRYVPSGQGVCSFSIAVNRTYASQSGEKKEETSFIRIVVWGRRGEVCNEYLKKGSPVFVEGRLQSRSWEAQDGQKRSSLEVIALNVQFLSRAPRGEDASVMDQDPTMMDESEVPPAKGSSSGVGSSSEDEVPF